MDVCLPLAGHIPDLGCDMALIVDAYFRQGNNGSWRGSQKSFKVVDQFPNRNL